MESVKEDIDKRIKEKFLSIDNKLKNSFQEIKKENISFKQKLFRLEENFNTEIKKINNEEKSNEVLVENAKLNQKIESLTKELTEATNLFNKENILIKQDIEYANKSLKNKLEEKELKNLKAEWFKGNITLINELNLTKEQIRELDKKSSFEFKSLKIEAKENKEKIKKLENQIVYLKGKIKSKEKKKGFFNKLIDISGKEEEKKEKSFFEKVVDKLAD
jgi:hypothetical protein